MAWLVLIVAFAIFCVSCVVTGVGVNYFLFESTVPMQVALDVSRGTATYQVSSDPGENAVLGDHFVATNERIRLDRQSQAVLLFRDNYQPGKLMGMVTMRLGSELHLGRAQRPRFEWSTLGYRIDLTDVSGEFEVYIPHGLDRDLIVTLQFVPEGQSEASVVYLSGGGNYTVSVSATEVTLFNRDGMQAAIIMPDLGNRFVATGERALVSFAAETPEVAPLPAPIDFLQTATFQTTDIDALTDTSDMLLPDLIWPWQCGNDGSQPPGDFGFAMPDGRPAIRLFRGNGATSNGRTSCFQAPGPSQTGRDVREFSSMVFEIAFYIENQSLTQCGGLGSECPLTLTFDYIIETMSDGELVEDVRTWYHGFYAKADPERSLPTRCSSCQLDHDYIYPGTWYTYESPNLFNIIPASERPVRLLRVGFYAEGHEYDVYVGDAALYATN